MTLGQLYYIKSFKCESRRLKVGFYDMADSKTVCETSGISPTQEIHQTESNKWWFEPGGGGVT